MSSGKAALGFNETPERVSFTNACMLDYQFSGLVASSLSQLQSKITDGLQELYDSGKPHHMLPFLVNAFFMLESLSMLANQQRRFAKAKNQVSKRQELRIPDSN